MMSMVNPFRSDTIPCPIEFKGYVNITGPENQNYGNSNLQQMNLVIHGHVKTV